MNLNGEMKEMNWHFIIKDMAFLLVDLGHLPSAEKHQGAGSKVGRVKRSGFPEDCQKDKWGIWVVMCFYETDFLHKLSSLSSCGMGGGERVKDRYRKYISYTGPVGKQTRSRSCQSGCTDMFQR